MSTDPGLHAFTSPTTDVTDHSLATRVFAACASRANLAQDVTTRLASASRILARAIHLMRRVALDESPLLRLHDTIAAHACQFEGAAQLAALIPPPHPVWTRLGALLVEITDAVAIEAAFAAGRRRLAELDRETAIELAAARTAHVALYPYALAALCPALDPEPLAAALRHLTIAAQTLNDLGSWKRDAAVGRPSLVVAGLELDEPIATPAAQQLLYRRLVMTGHLRSVVDLALTRLGLARDTCGEPADHMLVTVIAELEAHALAVRDALPTARA